MDEKIFNLLETMYADLTNKIDNMDNEMQEMKANMATKQDIVNMATKQDIVSLENKMDTNHKALYDGYIQSIEGITEVKDKLDKLTERVENQEIKLQVLKSVK